MSSFTGWIPGDAVRDTQELRRIASLPRRTWTEHSASVLALAFSAVLRTPVGSQTLFPVQAQALNDAGIHRGLFGSIVVGGGKTLLSLLLPTVLRLERPMLLVPAAIKQKTKREMREYAAHWNILCSRIRVESYEALGRDAQKNLLLNYKPDGLICDEVHRLKNPKAAVTRRVTRYMGDYPDTIFCGFSGTITKRSIKDYAHLLRWALKNNPPIPRGFVELEKWCAAIDEKSNPLALHLHPGALLTLLAEPQDDIGEGDTSTARRAFARRRNETPGVVATSEGYAGSSLYVVHEMNERKGLHETTLEGYIRHVRDTATTPDGWILPDGASMWACIRQLALGFYYRWKHHPPEPWKILRQLWYRQVREWIKSPPRGKVYDTELQVSNAVARGELPDIDDVYRKWREIEPTFPAERETAWIDDGAAQQCADWLAKHPKGICWTEHTAFGNRVSALSGLPFFRQKGKSDFGEEIEQATGPIIASVGSNATGRNLQAWNENYIASPSKDALKLEQLLGRTHRTGQPEDEVRATFLISCIEHVDGIESAIRDARYTEDSTGQKQKILHCDLDLPNHADIQRSPSRRYQR